jgi:hypothetical protein
VMKTDILYIDSLSYWNTNLTLLIDTAFEQKSTL